MANQTLGIPSDNKAGMGTSMSDMASRVTDKAADLGHKAVNAIDTQRGPAASGLDTAAASLHAGADKLPPQAAPLVHQAADKLGATADYVRNNRMKDMLADVETYVKAHPTQSLLGAVVVGFLAGRMLKRS
jgi:ElaB/YqjD/DUF883 family membrane-anchored ribosome-binding protein